MSGVGWFFVWFFSFKQQQSFTWQEFPSHALSGGFGFVHPPEEGAASCKYPLKRFWIASLLHLFFLIVVYI